MIKLHERVVNVGRDGSNIARGQCNTQQNVERIVQERIISTLDHGPRKPVTWLFVLVVQTISPNISQQAYESVSLG